MSELIKATEGLSFAPAKHAVLHAMDSPKISSFESVEAYEQNWRVLVDGIIHMSGLRDVQEGEKKAFAVTLGRFYGAMTIRDIKTAFELAYLGELDEYLPKDKHGQPDANHYGVFNFRFYAKILNAYVKYSSKVRVEIRQALPAPVQHISKAQKAQIEIQYIKDVLDLQSRICNDEPYSEWKLNGYLFDKLSEMGLISGDDIDVRDSDLSNAKKQMKEGKTQIIRAILERQFESPSALKELNSKAFLIARSRTIKEFLYVTDSELLKTKFNEHCARLKETIDNDHRD